MQQSKLESALEQTLNVGSGFILSYIIWITVITPVYDIQLSTSENLSVTLIFTIGLTAALEKANASTERFEREWYLRGDALEDWQKFAADVMPGCAAGAEWLDGLRARTAELLTPNAKVSGVPPQD